jgi:hypothetical protein
MAEQVGVTLQFLGLEVRGTLPEAAARSLLQSLTAAYLHPAPPLDATPVDLQAAFAPLPCEHGLPSVSQA